MEDVFEQTLSVAPLTEAALFAEVAASIGRYATIRKPDWRGVDARGGCKYELLAKETKETKESKESIATTGSKQPKSSPTQKPGAGFFAAAAEAAGGGRRGADYARALQRWLVGYVDTLALDEIEEMAK